MLKWILLTGSLILVVAGAVYHRRLQPQVALGTGYVAHQMCSCMFVAERSYASCLPDLLPSMDQIQSEQIKSNDRNGIRAWAPFFSERVAFHTPGLGCTVD